MLLLGILTLEWIYDVPVGYSLLYLGYELALVLLPGWLLYRALSARPGGPVRQIAFGWALGYVVEVLAFQLAGATGTTEVFIAYPLVIAAGSALASRRRRGHSEAPIEEELAVAGEDPDPIAADPPSRWFPWALAAAAMLAVLYVAIPVFAGVPLPGVNTVSYNPDFPWSLSLSAEAKNHFPVEDPNVAGEPLAYHYFVNVHQAAASQITGIDLALISFRLHIPPLVLVLVLGAVAAGGAFARNLWVGLIAACLIVFVGQLQLDTRGGLVFFGAFLTLLYTSPSFLFGLAIMFPLLILIGERISDRSGLAARRLGGEWALIAVLAVGSFNAKVSIVPLMLAGLAIFAAWFWWRERRVPGAVWLAGGILAAVGAAYWLLQYRGHSGGLGLDLTAGYEIFNNMPAVAAARTAVEDLLGDFPARSALLFVVGLPIGILGLFGPQLAGLAWIVRRRELPLRAEQIWLLSLLVVGVLALLLLREPGAGNQLYFLFSGVAAGCVLSAEGLRRAWRQRPELPQGWTPFVAIGAAWLAAVALLVVLPQVIDSSSLGESLADARRYLLWYGGLLLSFLALVLAARRFIPAGGWWAPAALLTAAVVSLGLIDTPATNVVPALERGDPSSADLYSDLTPELHEALVWIREETPTDAAIAVDVFSPNEFNYAAFAERRNLLGGFAYATESRDVGLEEVSTGRVNPFADRVELIKVAFYGGTDAAQTMYDDYGVRYLVVDKVNGPGTEVGRLAPLGPVVFENEAATVIEFESQ